MSTPTPARSVLTYRVPMPPAPAAVATANATTVVMRRLADVTALQPIPAAHQPVAMPLPPRTRPDHVTNTGPTRHPRPAATRRAPLGPWLIAVIAAVSGAVGGLVVLFVAIWMSRG